MFGKAAIGKVFAGQFSEFTITDRDYREVLIYRISLALSATFFAIGTLICLTQSPHFTLLGWLYWGFCLGLGVALGFIHIYLKLLHRTLQFFWLVGCLFSLGIASLAWQQQASFVQFAYDHPSTLWGIGFTFAALTGIYFKEAFCFNRLETKMQVVLAPALLIGHLGAWLSPSVEQGLLALWAMLFGVFAIRKLFQPIPSDIGDKSVFAYLEKEQQIDGTAS